MTDGEKQSKEEREVGREVAERGDRASQNFGARSSKGAIGKTLAPGPQKPYTKLVVVTGTPGEGARKNDDSPKVEEEEEEEEEEDKEEEKKKRLLE